MTVNVYLYDDGCSVLKERLDVTSENTRGVVLSSDVAGPLGPEWGATLSWSAPIAHPNVCRVLVDDPSTHYAPFRSGDLNGDQSSRVNAIIYPLPTSGGGGGTLPPAAPLSAIGAYIERQPSWNESEKVGVKGLVDVHSYYSFFAREQWVVVKLEAWQRILARLGIRSPGVLAPPAATEQGGGMVMG